MNQDIIKSIVGKIKQERVVRHSRCYFILRGLLWAIVSIFLLGFTLYMASMVGFIFIGNGLGALSGLGFMGLWIMLRSLPWVLIVIVIVLVLLLEFLAAKFSFVYKRPLIYSLLGVSIFMIIVSAMLAQTGMHRRAFELGEEYKVPFIGTMYHSYILRRDNEVHIGIIDVISNDLDKVTVILRDGEEKQVYITKETRMPHKSELIEGMMIMVVGDDDAGQIEALGIRPLERKHMLMPGHL